MNEPLHPLRLGEVLDKTVQLYRSRFLVFVGIAIVPTGTVLVVAAGFFAVFFAMGAQGSNLSTLGMGAGLLALAVGFLVAFPAVAGATALGYAAMSHAATRLFLGETITIRDSYKAIWQKGWSYVGLLFLLGLILGIAPVIAFFLVFFFTAISAALMGGHNPAASILIGFMVFGLMVVIAVITVWMLTCLSLTYPASVMEQVSPWNAIQRSFRLSKGTRGRVFVVYLLGMALSQALSMVVLIPLIILLTFVQGLNDPARAQTASLVIVFVTYAISFAVQAFTKPVYGIAMAIFYFDQRIRKEGFDIEWMMHQAGMIAPAPPPPPEAVPWLPANSLVPNFNTAPMPPDSAGPAKPVEETPS